MVVFGQSGCIWVSWLYSVKVVAFGHGDCIQAKVVVFGQKWMYSGKVDVFGQKLLYSG